MPVADDGPTPCLARLVRLESGELSLHFVGRRIDWQSSPLRSLDTETAGKSRSTASA